MAPWMIWLKNFFELIGAGATACYVVWKTLEFLMKLGMLVSSKTLRLNGHADKPKERTDMEKVFHERDN